MLSVFFALVVGTAIASPFDGHQLFARSSAPAANSFCSTASARCTASSDLQAVSTYCSSRVDITTVTQTVAPTSITLKPSCTPVSLPTPNSASVSGIASFSAADRLKERTPVTPLYSPSPVPDCFRSGNEVSSCNCFTFTTHTKTTKMPVATVTGPFRLAASGKPYSGYYARLYHPRPGFDYVVFDAENSINGQTWLLDENSYLRDASHLSWTGLQLDAPKGNTPVFVGKDTSKGSYPELKCHIQQDTCGLHCRANLNNLQQICFPGTDEWNINYEPPKEWDCKAFTPIVEAT